MQISAKQVKELRDATNVGMMECKRALQEAGGDLDAAIKLLRERGVAIAGKKASRAVNEGLVAAEVYNDNKNAVMIEVNCETDFVARNENFQAFVKTLVSKARDVADGGLAEAVKEDMTAKIAEIGENMRVNRNVSYSLSGSGMAAVYVHLGGKVGVMLELGCGKEETAASPVFAELAKDITLHIAAVSPKYIRPEDVPADVVDAEKEIYTSQMKNEGKPENIIEKIVTGKINKFLSQICLLKQEFVKDTDLTVEQLIQAKAKDLGDQIEVRRFVRYQLGE
jgi:elongation factor Ts